MIARHLEDSIRLAALNHFALVATGNNFIHLFHTKAAGLRHTPGVEGVAATMVMETIGTQFFPVHIENAPVVTVFTNAPADTAQIPALEAWGGVGDGDDGEPAGY